LNPAFNESSNASRKLSTEFVDVGGHIIIVFELGLRESALQALQLLQGFGEAREGARGSLGICGVLWLAFQPCTHGFNDLEFLKHGAMQPHDRVAGQWQSRHSRRFAIGWSLVWTCTRGRARLFRHGKTPVGLMLGQVRKAPAAHLCEPAER